MKVRRMKIRRMKVGRARLVQPAVDRLLAVVGTAADIGRRPVGVVDHDTRGRVVVGEHNHAAQLGVDDHANLCVVVGVIEIGHPPTLQVAHIDLVGADPAIRIAAVVQDAHAERGCAHGEVARLLDRLVVASPLELAVQRSAPKRGGDVSLVGASGLVALARGWIDQLDVDAGAVRPRQEDRMQMEAMDAFFVGQVGHLGVGRVDRARADSFDRIITAAPDEEPDIGHPVFAAAGVHKTHLGGAWDALEGAAVVGHLGLVAHVGVAGPLRERVVDVLGDRQVLVELHGSCGPAGDARRELLEGAQDALSAPVADGVGHIRAVVGGRRRQLHVEQVGDIRDRPRLTGLDELVVVERADVIFDALALGVDNRQKRAQHLAVICVASAVHRRQ